MPRIPLDPSPDGAADLRWALDLVGPIAQARSEVAAFVYLDPNWSLLGLRHSPALHADTAEVSIREVARDALSYNARYLLIAHNHPSGDATPSRDDLAFTRRLARTLEAIGVTLVDHIVLGANATTSFRQAGLL